MTREKAWIFHNTANADIPNNCLIIEHPLLIIAAADAQLSERILNIQ
jgi:hypothetical protein